MMRWTLALLSVSCLGACGGRIRGGTFDAVGYHHASVDYRIDNLAGGENILEPHWMLDNFRDATSLRDTPAYTVRRHFDADGDGRLEDIGQVPRDDLRYVSSRDAGVLFVRTLPIPRTLQSTEPSVLLRMFVEAMSGTGAVGSTLGDGTAVAVARTHTAVVLDERPIEIDGREGVVATIEVASVEQLMLDPSARTAKIRLALAHTDFRVPIDGRESIRYGFAPGLLMVGYSNLPPEFDRSLPEFESLLSRVRMQRIVSPPFEAAALACASEEGVAAFVIDRSYVLLRREDEPRRACFDTLRDVPTGSYGFRASERRYRVPPPPDVDASGPTAIDP